jgi:hypothetical protein
MLGLFGLSAHRQLAIPCHFLHGGAFSIKVIIKPNLKSAESRVLEYPSNL